MALADFLNADLETIGAQLRQGFAWWIDELRSMVPAALRGDRARHGVVAVLNGTETIFRRDGNRLAVAPANRLVALAIPPAQALVREVVLPRLPRADTRRLLALDLDRLTPLDPAAAVFDFVGVPGDPPLGRQYVRLAVITRATAAAALARADALGLVPIALGVEHGAAGIEFDFLPALAEERARAPLWAQPRTWWIAVALLLLSNLVFAIWSDAADVARLRDTVVAQSDAVQLAQRAKARVRAEDMRRAALLARRATRDPLPLLATITAALPPPAWVQRLSWDGQVARLIGFTTEAVDPLAALRRSHAFTSVRASSSDVQPALARYQPFDISAEPASAPSIKATRR